MAFGSNPVLTRGFAETETFGSRFLSQGAASQSMTVQGTVVKSAILLAFVLATGGVSWSLMATNPALGGIVWVGGLIVALIAAVVLCFWETAAPVLAPIYALAKGLALGGLTYAISHSFTFYT